MIEGVSTTLSADTIELSRDAAERLSNAVRRMCGESAASRAYTIGDKIEDVELYITEDEVCRLGDIIAGHTAIIMVYSGDMCQQQYEELVKYDELLAAYSGDVVMVVITESRAAMMSCRASDLMDDEPTFDDKSNLVFDLEADNERIIEAEAEIEAVSSESSESDIRQYKLLCDERGEFATRHRLSYAVSDEVCEIIKSELQVEIEQYGIVPAIYITNGDMMICYSYLNSEREIRPDADNIMDYYRKLSSID